MKILQNQSSSNLPCTQNVGMKPIFPCKDKWYYPLWKSCLRFSNNIIKYPTEMFPTRKKHIHILQLSLSIVLSKKIGRYIQEISMHACMYIYSSVVHIIYGTCTMAACSFTPLNPTATDAADIIMGPQRKRITIPIIALFVPQAIIRGWRAMNSPAAITNSSLSKS